MAYSRQPHENLYDQTSESSRSHFIKLTYDQIDVIINAELSSCLALFVLFYFKLTFHDSIDLSSSHEVLLFSLHG